MCLMSYVGVAVLCGCVSCGLWVPLMWSVGGRELPWALQPVFTGQENVSEGCVCLMSEVGVAALCGCVSCGLWVPLIWWVCGRELPWALQPVFTGQEKGCVCLMSEMDVAALCGCVSYGLWVPLMWSVCGLKLPWALQPLASVYWRLRECVSSKRSGVAALCACVSCGLWVPLKWSVCGHGLLWALRPLASV